MTVQKAEDTRWQELRRRAERMMGRRPTGTDQEEDPQIQQLLQEIMLSQSELELQNEALLQTNGPSKRPRRNIITSIAATPSFSISPPTARWSSTLTM